MAYLAGLIQNLPKPVGIMIGHDARYWQVYEVCDILQLSIPDDVAVLGVDNNPLVCLSTPVGLSSVDPGYLEMGARAAELLDRCFQGEPLPTAPVLMAPRQLVERESTNTHAVEDPHVSAALRILRESFHEPLTMRKIAERVGISKDHLARLFTRQTGHSLHQELLRLRMEHSQRLLSETTLPLQEIAESIGMRQASHFAALFKNYSGETAGEWRRKNMLKSPKTPF
jgi:LacI family transcriptional regulator